MSKTKNLKKASRRARVIASDIAIYPDIQEKIERGIKNDNLFEELDSVIREARQDYRAHVDENIIENTIIFEMAFIDKVFSETGDIDSPIW
jgi:uncharacterized protein YeeX (DUF496 family)